MKELKAVEATVQRSLSGETDVRPGDTLVVGVSGGPDSLCLLYALHRVKAVLPLQLHVAHLDHDLRPDSAEDARFVSQLALELGLRLSVEKGDVRGFQRRHRTTLEEAAREVRYAFLARLAREVGAKAVAVGHTADDQAETLLMHLLRGAGLAGLRGMQPQSLWRSRTTGAEVMVVRPLLAVRRQQTEAYCAALGLEPRRDASNQSHRFLRNRVRSQLMPVLRKFNPALEEGLLRTAEAASVELSFWDEEVRRIRPQVVREEGPALVFDREALAALHPALQRHLLLSVADERLGGHQWSAIESMLSALEKPVGSRVTLPQGQAFTVGYDAFYLGGEPACPLPPLEGESKVVVPGETWVGGWRLVGKLLPAPPTEMPGPGGRACLDFDAVGPELVLRARRPGDVFQPLGMEQAKRLQDFFVDARVPRAWRTRVPLLCAPRGIAWVAGWRIAHWARVTPDTKTVLCLELSRVQ